MTLKGQIALLKIGCSVTSVPIIQPANSTLIYAINLTAEILNKVYDILFYEISYEHFHGNLMGAH